jgi:TonB family protein
MNLGPLLGTVILFCGQLMVDAAAQESQSPPRALTSLEVSARDYPTDALFATEEGNVTLHLHIGPNGLVTGVQIAGSSGSPSLDAATAYLAQSRWRFEPVIQNGEAIASETRVDVVWRLPLESAEAYFLAPSTGPLTGATPRRIDSAFVAASDYPGESLRRREAGIVGILALVNSDGSVERVDVPESSGFARLDNAAARFVQRQFRYDTATLTAPTWVSVSVTYVVSPMTVRPPRCYSRPVIAVEEILITGTLTTLPTAPLSPRRERWVKVAGSGQVTDALISTNKGWRRMSDALVAQIPQQPPTQMESCWYHQPRQ